MNYADVRIRYTADGVFVHVAVIDRLLWYSPTPTTEQLTAYDAVSLYFHDGHHAYQFDAQMTWWEPDRSDWQASYVDGVQTSVPFTTTDVWRGDEPNNDTDDRGYFIQFTIPFSPTAGDEWQAAVIVHDRDDEQGTPIPNQYWPVGMALDDTSTWGTLRFVSPVTHTAVIGDTRQSIATAVMDGMVGGSSVCGQGIGFWGEWGDTNYDGVHFANVQNQIDIADWPCFSRYYVMFPGINLEDGQFIVSAVIHLHQFGNGGQGWQPPPQPSFIQVMATAVNWHSDTITWNNAPPALENYSGVWVYPLDDYPEPPGVLYEWDVTTAVNLGYTSFVFYSSDLPQHSGRYFWATSFYLEDARPKLVVYRGDIDGRVYLPMIMRRLPR